MITPPDAESAPGGASGAAPERRRARWLLLAIILLALASHSQSLTWGLPSRERTALSWREPERARRILAALSANDIRNSWTRLFPYLEPEKRTADIPAWVFNCIRSAHADEHNILKSISNMKPGRGDFNPHFFVWGTFYFYVVAAALKAAQVTGFLTITSDLYYYFAHPEAMARFYVVGRAVSLLFTLGTVALTAWLAALAGCRASGLLAALLCALAPLTVAYGHFMTTDPMLLFFHTLAVCLALRAWRRGGGWRDYLLAGAGIGLAAGAKYNGALSCLALMAVHLLLVARNHQWFAVGEHLKLAAAGAVSLISFLAVTPYALLAWPEFRHSLDILAGVSSGGASANAGFYFGAFRAGTDPFLLLSACLGLGWAVRQRRVGLILLAMLAAVYFSFFSTIALREDRQLLPLVPLVCVLAAAWLREGVARPGSRLRSGVAGIIVIAILASMLPRTMMITGLMTDPDVRVAAGRWVRDHVAPGTTVGIVGPVLQYHQPPIDFTEYRILTVPGEPADFERLIASAPEFIIVNAEHLEAAGAGVNTILDRGKYAPVATIRDWPRFFCLDLWNYRFIPLRTYIAPRYVIYRKL